MRTLYLMRHAQSDWGASFGSDHERPINGRGRGAAAAMGLWISGTGRIPDQVTCSTAMRARMTAEIAQTAGEWSAALRFEEALYEAHPTAIFHVIGAMDDSVGTAMLIAHEPGMSATLSLLLGDAPVKFPTAAAACVELAIDSWSHVEPACGRLLWFLPPRLLNGV